MTAFQHAQRIETLAVLLCVVSVEADAEADRCRPVNMEIPKNITQWPAARGENALKPLSVWAMLQELTLS